MRTRNLTSFNAHSCLPDSVSLLSTQWALLILTICSPLSIAMRAARKQCARITFAAGVETSFSRPSAAPYIDTTASDAIQYSTEYMALVGSFVAQRVRAGARALVGHHVSHGASTANVNFRQNEVLERDTFGARTPGRWSIVCYCITCEYGPSGSRVSLTCHAYAFTQRAAS